MTVQEYEAKFSEDDAPGWDAIAGALEKIYDPANERHYASWLHASLGGEDYLDGVVYLTPSRACRTATS